MTQQNPAPTQSSSDWTAVFSSYRPLSIRYAPGEMVCQAGSYLAGMHLIVSGVVSDIVPSKKGEHPHCDVLGPGDLIGLEILKKSRDALSTSLCRAITGVELLFVERSQLEAALSDNPALQRSVLGYAIERYLLVRSDLRSEEAAEARLSRLLLRLGESCGRPAEDGRTILPSEVTLRTLGELLGMSSRTLRQARPTIQSLRIEASGIDFHPSEIRKTLEHQLP